MQCFLLVVAVSAWEYGPQLPVTVYEHRSALFEDGSVVISGGRNVSGTFGEVYRLAVNNLRSTWHWQRLPPITPRLSHTMTALANGYILVTGGYNLGYSAEGLLLNPVTLNWTNVSNTMNTSRAFHRAVLLNTGNVLVCGGQGNAGLLRTCDLFSGGRFVPAASMISGRDSYTVTVLKNGSALLAGGGAGTLCELYHPLTDSFTSTGNMSIWRTNYAAALLPNGRVLAVGGQTNDTTTATCELYDPTNGTWTPTGSMSVARSYHQVALQWVFVYVVGGLVTGGGTAILEVYNITSGTWTVDTPMLVGRYLHTLVQFSNGYLFAVGGVGASQTNDLATTEIGATYDSVVRCCDGEGAGSKIWALSSFPLVILGVILS